MWNTRPLNSAGPNPFGIQGQNDRNEQLSAESVKCPTCGSNIRFEPELRAMMCRNCGNIYDPDTMEPRGSFGVTKEHDYMGDSDMSEEDKKRHEIVCNSCGAAMVADEHTMSTMCPFCGSPALITRRMTREFKPDYIIPFKIDKDQAKKNMQEWLGRTKYTPLGFKNKSRLTNITALYVPFWLVDCVVNSDMSGTGKKKKGIERSIYEVNTKFKYYVKGVPFDASVKIANKLMEAIEPFDYKDMVKFESKYLQGFYADKYEQLPTDITSRIIKRMGRFSIDETDIVANKYSEYEARFDKNFTYISDVSVKYCLLPVWFMTVEFEGSQYQFAVNGQTGEASGQAPTTSALDKIYEINKFTDSIWKFIPIGLAIIIPCIMWALVSSYNVTPVKTFFVNLLLVLEVLLIISIVLLFVLKYSTGFISKKINDTVNEVNDFDKDPGLDAYLDSTHHSDIDVSEKLLRYVVDILDGDGKKIGERSIEL